MNNVLDIPLLEETPAWDNPASLHDQLLEKGLQGRLQSQSWDAWKVSLQEFDVRFTMAYHDTVLLTLFRVREPEIRATYREHLDPVFEDSCVEVFVGDERGMYVNVECNPYGAILAGWGYSRSDRAWYGDDFYSAMHVWTHYDGSAGEGTWEALLGIPLSHTPLKLSSVRGGLPTHEDVSPKQSLGDSVLRGNLYKCGDKLRQPHYLSWSPIATESPDFHRKEYFGTFRFV